MANKNLGYFLYNKLYAMNKAEQNFMRFVPRPYQKELTDMIEETMKDEDMRRPIFISWCRRAGKDQWAFARAVQRCISVPNTRVLYIFPTARQGRKNILEGVTTEGKNWIESIVNPDVIKRTRTGSLYYNDGTIKFKNGSQIDIYGDDADSVVGGNVNILIISEASMVRESTFEYLYPSVMKAGGEVICISTPRLHSWFNKKFLDPDAPVIKSRLTAYEIYDNDGSRIYTDDELQFAQTLMSEEKFASDYMCDMNTYNETSIYGRSLRKAQFTDMPSLECKPVFISFDLGISDNCAMTFGIFENEKLKIVYQYRNREKPTKHYIDVIEDWRIRNNVDKTMIRIILPQDGGSVMDFVRYLASRAEVFRNFGYHVDVLNFIPVLRGIEITRTGIETGDIQFVNSQRVKEFIEVLKGYEWKTSLSGEILYVPKHGSGYSASNDADSLEYLAITFLYNKYITDNPIQSGVVFSNH